MPDQMPSDLRIAVQKMIDAGESEENIATAIRNRKALMKKQPDQPSIKDEVAQTTGDSYKGPTDFWGGFKQALTGGDAISAGAQGGLGFLKGAIADLPSSIYGGLQGVANLISDPIGTV